MRRFPFLLFLLVVILFPLFIPSPAISEVSAKKANGSIASIHSMSPSAGIVGDTVSFEGRGLGKSISVEFSGVSTTPFLREIVNPSSASCGTFSERFCVKVPAGAKSGDVKVTTDGVILDTGPFTVYLKFVKADLDDEPVHGLPVGGEPPPSGRPSAPLGLGPLPMNVDADMDLPISAPERIVAKIIKNPPIIPPFPIIPPTEPVVPPPVIYGKDMWSKNATIIYVIDISGSMGMDYGTYTAANNSTQVGCRLDRAKAELVKSVVSLPKNFKFNIFSYDCSVYPWEPVLVPDDDFHKRGAVSWVEKLQPQGATNTGGAMTVSLESNRDCTLFVLLTDGQPTCPGSDIPTHRKQIRTANGQRATINVFGIGASGDFKQFCLDIAADNGGSYTDVR